MAVDAGRWDLPRAPREAPDFTAQTLRGEDIRLSSLRGRGVLLHFWATWCLPCVKELPALQALQRDCGEQLRIITVVAEPEGEEMVRRFIRTHGLDLPVIFTHNLALRRTWEVRLLPMTYFIDADGIIRGRLTAAGDWQGSELRRLPGEHGIACQ